ncbi:hypothetical protein V2J09_013040 [Rumex salicifolius]
MLDHEYLFDSLLVDPCDEVGDMIQEATELVEKAKEMIEPLPKSDVMTEKGKDLGDKYQMLIKVSHKRRKSWMVLKILRCTRELLRNRGVKGAIFNGDVTKNSMELDSQNVRSSRRVFKENPLICTPYTIGQKKKHHLNEVLFYMRKRIHDEPGVHKNVVILDWI